MNELELICLHTSIDIVCTQLNGFNYCYLTIIILFIICLHIVVSSIAHINTFLFAQFQVLLFNMNNSIQHDSYM